MKFEFAAEQFLREYTVLTQGQRSPVYVAAHRRRLDNHIFPFMRDKYLPEVTPGLLQDYRVYRHEKAIQLYGKPPARNTVHQEAVVIRQVQGADVYQIAKNCRMSVEMIEKYYASHLVNTLDTTAINIRKPKRSRARKSPESGEEPTGKKPAKPKKKKP